MLSTSQKPQKCAEHRWKVSLYYSVEHKLTQVTWRAGATLAEFILGCWKQIVSLSNWLIHNAKLWFTLASDSDCSYLSDFDLKGFLTAANKFVILVAIETLLLWLSLTSGPPSPSPPDVPLVSSCLPSSMPTSPPSPDPGVAPSAPASLVFLESGFSVLSVSLLQLLIESKIMLYTLWITINIVKCDIK